jgi:hypothetical protein
MVQDVVPILVALVLLSCVFVLVSRRERRRKESSRRDARESLFAFQSLPWLACSVPVHMGPLLRAAELGYDSLEEALQAVEDPETVREWGGFPVYWWVLASLRKTGEDRDGAVEALREVLALPGLAPHDEARTWSVLRSFGQAPPAVEANRLLGVVVEVANRGRTVAIAAYADGEAWLYELDGWAGQGRMRLEGKSIRDAAIALVQAAGTAAPQFAPAADHPEPSPGHVRFTLLSPSGFRAAEAHEIQAQAPDHALHGSYTALQRLVAVHRKPRAQE